MAKTRFNHVKVSGITAVVPENIINIDDEIAYFKNDPKLLERNKKILGLGTRHVVDDVTTNADLCEAAARQLIDNMSVDKNTIDTLIVASTSHDYSYPASACLLQGRLDLSEECACFDISGLACSAYVYGLWMAHSLIASGAAKKCLLLVGDIVSRHSDKRNRNSNMLFGDAGTATLIEYTEEDRPSYFNLGTRGKQWNKIVAPAGGYALPIRKDIADIEETDHAGNVWHLWDEVMKGMDVFKFTMDVGPKGIKEILAFAGEQAEGIDYFAIHQANKQIVNTVAMHAGLPKDKFSTETFTRYGNCGSAAVTMDLCRQLQTQSLNKVGLATFGVGLSWGFAVLNLTGIHMDKIHLYRTPANKPDRAATIQHWIDYFKGDHHES